MIWLNTSIKFHNKMKLKFLFTSEFMQYFYTGLNKSEDVSLTQLYNVCQIYFR